MTNMMAAISGVLGGAKTVQPIFRAYEKFLGMSKKGRRGFEASGTERKISHTEEGL